MAETEASNRVRPRRRPKFLSLQDDKLADSAEPRTMPSQSQGLEKDVDSSSTPSEPRSPMNIHIPGFKSSAELALAALQYLPTPVIVLSSFKTIVLANDAMGRLLGLDSCRDDSNEDVSPTQILTGKSLSQVGIDIVQDGRVLWVTWDHFLDDLEHERNIPEENDSQSFDHGDVTPTAENAQTMTPRSSSTERGKEIVHDSVVEVVLTQEKALISNLVQRGASKRMKHTYAKMIITIWELVGQKFYSLSFTSTDPNTSSKSRAKSRTVTKASTLNESGPGSSSCFTSCSSPSSTVSGQSSARGSSSSLYVSPTTSTSMSCSPFPPLGPPNPTAHSPSALQKIIFMKDALLDNTDIPIIAMWKDESLSVPNRAARRLFYPGADVSKIDGFELLTKWKVYNEDFSETLEPKDYPIAQLVRTQKPFQSRRLGMYDPDDGKQIVFDVRGEDIRDENGEFLAGIVICHDITDIKRTMKEKDEENDKRFELICDTSPQMIWTTKSNGDYDWFSRRWYEYTGLSKEKSLGKGWRLPFHPDDLTSAERRWAYSLRTGDPYVTEYRCRSKDGEWRWMLGRALPLRNKKTRKIEKWFGSCTDIHESVEARRTAKRSRQQLLSVLGHAQVTIFSVDRNRTLTLLEGSFIWDLENSESGDETSTRSSIDQYIGKNVYEVLGTHERGRNFRGGIPKSLQPVEDILTGKTMEEVREHVIDGRSYRTRFVPILARPPTGSQTADSYIDGVIGVSMDITELKEREAELETQEKENTRLLAKEAAANAASRLKSQFLANMSHEIRTPIAGVIGMAELLIDMGLTEEQMECAENIQRSANGLLTVINDILDLSKVESGRLDIEEVQFSLSVVVRDVIKMMRFVAERKNLLFEAEISAIVGNGMAIMGDPGRLRQIITNLLTNSIKFTTEGKVKLSVLKERETPEHIEIKFVVEDSGIGIEEEVRKRLFKPFSQADSSTARRYGGTGLGLTICKNLVRLMHGRITLESSLGNGTTATFWIPFNKPQFHDGTTLVDIGSLPDRLQSDMSVSCTSSDYNHDSSPSKFQDSSQSFGATGSKPMLMTPPISDDIQLPMADRKKIEVLVVEDNAINQQIAIKTVQKLGFQVRAVWNGKEALDYLAAAQGANASYKKPDIILMDVQMPVIDGYRASHIIRHHLPYMSFSKDVPIVAMTASAIQGDKEKCQNAGMDDYLSKPVKGKTLERMLVKWATQKRTPSTTTPYASNECSQPIDHEYVETQERPSIPPRQKSHLGSKREIDPLASLVGTEGERAEGRSIAEEQAAELRNEKLIHAATDGYNGMALASPPPPPESAKRASQELTIANMERLEQEHEKGGSNVVPVVETSPFSYTHAELKKEESSGTEGSGLGEMNGPTARRPNYGKRLDSESTVRGR